MTTGLKVRALQAGYGRAQTLHGIDLDVAPGEIVILLGANGAGKTTTLRALSGLLRAAGMLTFDDKSLVGQGSDALLRRGIAHVPQGRGTFSDLTVEENLRVGAHTRRASEFIVSRDYWLDVFPILKDRRTQAAGSLSGGEQQMLALARAMMCRPRLLLLDEPSLGLAPVITQQIFAVLQKVNVDLGTAMLIVEQNADLAVDVAHRIYLMESGRMVMSGTAQEVRVDDSLRRAYLGY
jgi:branched-chain amino acid transport system ATP-binding protein